MLLLIVACAMLFLQVRGSEYESMVGGGNNTLTHLNHSVEYTLFLNNNKDKHRFVVLHAPWCGHCVSFMPILNKLAQSNHRPELVIAEIDADANIGLGVKSFPTMRLWRKGANAQTFEDVTVPRTEADLNAFFDKLTSMA